MDSIRYTYLDALMTKNDAVFFKQLGKRIAELRKDMGLTQVQLAEILTISQQHMAACEAGRRKVPSAQLPMLAQLFGISTDELLGVQGKPAKRGPTARLQQQMDQISLLPRTRQKFVMEMLDAVIQQQAS